MRCSPSRMVHFSSSFVDKSNNKKLLDEGRLIFCDKTCFRARRIHAFAFIGLLLCIVLSSENVNSATLHIILSASYENCRTDAVLLSRTCMRIGKYGQTLHSRFIRKFHFEFWSDTKCDANWIAREREGGVGRQKKNYNKKAKKERENIRIRRTMTYDV